MKSKHFNHYKNFNKTLKTPSSNKNKNRVFPPNLFPPQPNPDGLNCKVYRNLPKPQTHPLNNNSSSTTTTNNQPSIPISNISVKSTSPTYSGNKSNNTTLHSKPAFAGLYSNSSQRITLNPNLKQQIPLPINMPNLNINYGSPNCLNILLPGTYELTFNLFISSTLPCTLITSVRRNFLDIQQSLITRTLVSQQSIFNNSFFVNLSHGDVIDMSISSVNFSNLILSSGYANSLCIKKIN